MVERCSNGVAFLVLEPEPSVRTGIRVDIYDGADPNTLLARLPLTWGRRWTDPLKGTGSGEFWIHAADETLAANPGLLAYGNIARFSLDERYRFAIQIEHLDRVQVEADGDVSRTIKVSGRGVLSKLEEAVLYPTGGLAGDPIRPFTDADADDLLGVAFDEAQARGALAGLDRDFTDTRDSNNAPYDVTLTVEERAGNSVLRIAERLAELAGDVYMTTAGILKFVNQRGIDRSQQLPDAGPVILQPADNLTELTRSEDGAIRNTLLIETSAGFLERSRGASVSTHGRRETYLSLGNISDGDGVDRAAEAVFAQSADPAAQIGSAVLDKDGARPYVDWSVGDWVLAPDEDDTLERFRVRALTVSETAEGEPVFTPELATITEELENRYERWLAAMAKGTVGGTAGSVAEPVKAPREVITAIDAGIGDHVALQPHFDELADLADTDVTGLSDDDVLRYNSAGGAWEPEALDLDALDDVDLTTAPTDGQVLKYDDASGLWVPAADETGGGGGGGGSAIRGAGSISDPDTSTQIIHGLGSTPALGEIQVQALNTDHAVARVAVTNPTSNTFDVEVDPAPGSTKTFEFGWLLVTADPAPVPDLPTTDMILRLKAENLVGVVADGNPIATWADTSGQGNDATQATSADQPTLDEGTINGLATVRFAGSHFMNLPNLFSGASEGEIFAVLKIDNDPPGSSASGLWKFGTSSDSDHYPWTTGDVYSSWGSNSRKNTGNPSLPLTGYHVLNISSAAGAFTLRLNNDTHYSSGNTVAFTTAPKFGQSHSSAYHLQGNIAEIVCYSSVLSAGARSDAYAHLAGTYGII